MTRSIMNVIEDLIDWSEPNIKVQQTRAEVSDLIYGYFKDLGKPIEGVKNTYKDVKNFSDGIAFCTVNKIMLGDAKGDFRPDDYITDVELVCTLSRVYFELISRK